MTWRSLVGYAVLLGCAHAPPSSPPPHSFTGFGDADLVVLTRSGELVAYAQSPLHETAHTTLFAGEPPPRFELAWIDRDHLAVRRGERDLAVLSASGLTSIALPPAANFEQSRPTTNADNVEHTIGRSGFGGANVIDGQVWWVECAWGFSDKTGGMRGCLSAGYMRVWPEDPNHVVVDKAPDAGHLPVLPTVAHSGFRIDHEDGVATCTDSNGNRVTLAHESPLAHWITTTPSLVLLSNGSNGAWALFDRCTDHPLRTGGYYRFVDDHRWIASETGAASVLHLYRDATLLGELPPLRDILVRPTRQP